MFMPLKNCIARLRLRQPAPREFPLPQAFGHLSSQVKHHILKLELGILLEKEAA
jgi:hypothetical protein